MAAPLISSAETGRLILVSGPARSGKSEWAERLAQQSGQTVFYVATSRLEPTDGEWQTRIEQHRRRRPVSWTTLEVPLALADTIQNAGANTCLLIDSLGTWLANGIDQDEVSWNQTVGAFLQALQQTAATVILVAEEVGWGIVPAYPMGRLFRDRMGILVRRASAIAHPVYLVTTGHVLNLSQLGEPLAGEQGTGNRGRGTHEE